MRTVRHDCRDDQTRVWKTMRLVQDAHGTFRCATIIGLTGLMGISEKTVRAYLVYLIDVRVVETVDDRSLRIVNDGDAPPLPTTMEAQSRAIELALWNGIRALRTFTPQELAVTATTDTLAVTTRDAVIYVNLLRRAGYVAQVSRTIHRLLPSHNTGPRAPIVHRVGNRRALFDLNLMKAVNVTKSTIDIGRAA